MRKLITILFILLVFVGFLIIGQQYMESLYVPDENLQELNGSQNCKISKDCIRDGCSGE